MLRRAPSRRWLAACGLLLLVFGLRTTLTSCHYSVTADEFHHLPAGLLHLERGDFSPIDMNPPLARMLQALAIVGERPLLPVEGILHASQPSSSWLLGYAFQRANRSRYHALFEHARAVTMLLGVLLLASVALWSRRVWGEAGALASLAFLAFEPNTVAHAGLVTTDVPFCLMAVLTLWAAQRMFAGGGAAWVVWLGAALGLAQLTRFTGLVLYPALLVAALIVARPLWPALTKLAAAGLLSLLVLNAGYLFHGSLSSAASYSFRGEAWRTLQRWSVPVPLPLDYMRAVELKAVQNEGGFPTYLNGVVYSEGAPWYYDLEALALKTPLAGLALLLGSLLLRPGPLASPARAALVLCGATAGSLLLAASLTDLNLGVRYVLLVLPLAAFLLGGLARRAPRAVGLALTLYALESVAAHPNELAFFNLAAGGSRGGLRYLAASNLDWGQDLPALRRFMTERGIPSIRLAYFGRVDPRLYGVEYELPDLAFPPGWYAISANFLVGRPYGLYDLRTGEQRITDGREFARFRAMEPTAVAGASIYVYELPP